MSGDLPEENPMEGLAHHPAEVARLLVEVARLRAAVARPLAEAARPAVAFERVGQLMGRG